jgi:outer membrane protein assembly factor BamD
MRIYNLILLCFVSAMMSSCKSKKMNDEAIQPAKLIYHEGQELIEAGKYKKAAESFERVYFQHPGSNITPYAELMEAYSLFLDTKYEDASDVLDNFIKIHPLHEDIVYAHYLKGLAEYMQISRAELDQTATANAESAFKELITKFPSTKYAIDASLKIDLVYDHLAGSEMDVGRYYLHVNNPISAITRFQNVIQNYGTTEHVPEALYRMVESYMILSLKPEAEKYGAVLGHNYNDSKWYKRAHKLLTGKYSVKKKQRAYRKNAKSKG